LWTLSRGLARSRSKYYETLRKADSRRAGDFDGRGNLSERALAEFCHFFLTTADDQIQFMSGCLKLQDFSTRISRYLQFEALHILKHREQLDKLLRAILVAGEVERGRVPEIVGRKGTVSREVISLGLEEGLLVTTGPKGPLRLAFPAKVLNSYFPNLFIDLPA
jgi:Fic family protein